MMLPRAGEACGLREEVIGVDARLRQPVERQVEPAVARILAHVAGDVGELHGDAQVAGARDGIGSRTCMTSDIMAPTVPATRTA